MKLILSFTVISAVIITYIIVCITSVGNANRTKFDGLQGQISDASSTSLDTVTQEVTNESVPAGSNNVEQPLATDSAGNAIPSTALPLPGNQASTDSNQGTIPNSNDSAMTNQGNNSSTSGTIPNASSSNASGSGTPSSTTPSSSTSSSNSANNQSGSDNTSLAVTNPNSGTQGSGSNNTTPGITGTHPDNAITPTTQKPNADETTKKPTAKPVETPAPTKAPANKALPTVYIEETSRWGSMYDYYYMYRIFIYNNTSSKYSNWSVSINIPDKATLSGIWNANYSGRTGTISLTPIDWNQTIAVGDIVCVDIQIHSKNRISAKDLAVSIH